MSAHRHDRRHDVHRDRRPSGRRAATVLAAAGLALLLTGCIRDGLHPVGDGGLATGLYQTAGARAGAVCAYSRHGGDGTRFGDGFSSRDNGVQYIELMFTDRAFATAGCEVWIPASTLGPTVPAGQDLPQGMFRVGIDVQPGVYSTTGNAICTWTRLRNARHEAGSVITTGSVNGAFGFVTVQPGDAFFETRGCAPWHRVN